MKKVNFYVIFAFYYPYYTQYQLSGLLSILFELILFENIK